jgi:hypothetical protein
MSYNAWLYGSANPLRYADPSGCFNCRFETADVETYVTKTLGWGSCKAPIEYTLDVLESRGGKLSATIVWAFRDADAHEGIDIVFTTGGNLNGGRNRFPPKAYVLIPGDLQKDLRADAANMSLNGLAYVSLLSHEFWHATMQPAGTANIPFMEQAAFMVQREVLKELGGDQDQLNALQDIINHPSDYGYRWTIPMYFQACVLDYAYTHPSSIFSDFNVERRLNILSGFNR